MIRRCMPILCTLLFGLATACDSPGSQGPSDFSPADTANDTAPSDAAAVDVPADPGPADTPAKDEGGEPDVETPPSCNAITQTGCEATENCTYTASDDKPTCLPEGEAAYGEACDKIGCKRGICLSINGTDTVCYKFCKTSGHCDAGVKCQELTDAPYKVCEVSEVYDKCDLLAQNCPDGKACYLAGQPTPVCLPAGSKPAGESCQGSGECVPSTICYADRCLRICDRSLPEPCGDPFTPCSSLYGNVGYCDE